MKMDDDQLLDLLRRKEEAAGAYVWGQLGNEREKALREYHRLPYGNEEEGWSQIVSSDIQDTVEWILPALLKTFSSTDKAVSFEPTRANDVKGAEQATDAVNYVFHKQNNGFLVLYTAMKDMLTVRNCAVMWRKEDQQTVSTVPFKDATAEMLAMLTEQGGEIMEASQGPIMGPQGMDEMGQQVFGYSGRIKKTEKRTIIKVEAFSPEDLLVDRDWNSPLLAECPYVARLMRVTLSDIKQMGFDATAEELRSSDGTSYSPDASFRLNKINQTENGTGAFTDYYSEDEALAQGWLRIEFVLVDVDGDGIAERHCIYRLKNKILKNEVVSHVPIATCSPVLNTHRWDGVGMGDIVGDLQKMHTELLRQTFNSSYLANNPRTKVLTDANWSPLANIDDLLDSRPGGIIRVRQLDAVTEQITPFVAGATMPLLDYIQTMRENRTGVSRTSQGLNPDSLNNTATGRQIDQSSAQQRIELIARIAGEVLVKPIFAGILKLLTEGGMEKLYFRLRDEFVEMDPNEWRDQYDMTINVGLGTGDKAMQAGALRDIYQMQTAGMQMGLADPTKIYHTASKLIENAGYKDVQNFLIDPKTAPPQQPKEPPIEVQLEQMKQQGAAQLAQMKMQAEGQGKQADMQASMQAKQVELQATAQMEQFKQQSTMQLEIEKLKMQAQIEREKMQMQLEVDRNRQEVEALQKQAEMENEAQLSQLRDQMEQAHKNATLNHAMQLEEMKQQGAMQLTQMKIEAAERIKTMELGSAAVLRQEEADQLQEAEGNDPLTNLAGMHGDLMQGLTGLTAQLGKAKKIIRGADGRAEGIE